MRKIHECRNLNSFAHFRDKYTPGSMYPHVQLQIVAFTTNFLSDDHLHTVISALVSLNCPAGWHCNLLKIKKRDRYYEVTEWKVIQHNSRPKDASYMCVYTPFYGKLLSCY